MEEGGCFVLLGKSNAGATGIEPRSIVTTFLLSGF